MAAMLLGMTGCNGGTETTENTIAGEKVTTTTGVNEETKGTTTTAGTEKKGTKNTPKDGWNTGFPVEGISAVPPWELEPLDTMSDFPIITTAKEEPINIPLPNKINTFCNNPFERYFTVQGEYIYYYDEIIKDNVRYKIWVRENVETGEKIGFDIKMPDNSSVIYPIGNTLYKYTYTNSSGGDRNFSFFSYEISEKNKRLSEICGMTVYSTTQTELFTFELVVALNIDVAISESGVVILYADALNRVIGGKIYRLDGEFVSELSTPEDGVFSVEWNSRYGDVCYHITENKIATVQRIGEDLFDRENCNYYYIEYDWNGDIINAIKLDSEFIKYGSEYYKGFAAESQNGEKEALFIDPDSLMLGSDGYCYNIITVGGATNIDKKANQWIHKVDVSDMDSEAYSAHNEAVTPTTSGDRIYMLREYNGYLYYYITIGEYDGGFKGRKYMRVNANGGEPEELYTVEDINELNSRDLALALYPYVSE